MSGITRPRPGTARFSGDQPRDPRRWKPSTWAWRALELTGAVALAAYPVATGARWAYELARLGWHAWPF